MSRKRGRGHYCWSCNRVRANERFSGRGHSRHLCKECARLGQGELAYRQAVRNLESLLTDGARIGKRKRAQFRKFLEHENARVRAYALEIEAADAIDRAEYRAMHDLDEELLESGVGPLLLGFEEEEQEQEEEQEEFRVPPF